MEDDYIITEPAELRLPFDAYPLAMLCKKCGHNWGAHYGRECPNQEIPSTFAPVDNHSH